MATDQRIVPDYMADCLYSHLTAAQADMQTVADCVPWMVQLMLTQTCVMLLQCLLCPLPVRARARACERERECVCVSVVSYQTQIT